MMQGAESKIKKDKISVTAFFFGMFIIFAFTCNNMFFGITEYYYLPILLIFFGGIYLLNKKMTIGIEHYCSLAILLILLMNLFLYNTDLNRGVHFSYILFIVMFIVTTLKKFNKGEIRFLMNCYILSAVIISLMIILFSQEFNDWIGSSRYTIKSLGNVYIDPNFLAAFINIPVIISINRLLASKNRKYVYLILIIIIASAVLLTGSRAAVVALFLGSCLVISCYSNRLFIIILLLPILGLIIYVFLPYDTINRMFINSYFAVRLLNWRFALKAFMQKPFVGYGITETSSFLNTMFGYKRAAQNTFLAFLVQFGILGSIPFFIIIMKIVLVTFKKDMRVLSGITVSVFFTSLMIEANISITLWVVIILLYLVNSYKKRNPEVDIKSII